LKSYLFYKMIPFALIAFYLSMVYMGQMLGVEEIHTFYHWAVYKVARTEIKDFAIQITEVDGVTLDPPADFVEKKEIFSKLRFLCPGDDCEQNVINKMGRALGRKESSQSFIWKQLFEKAYLGGYQSSIKYTLVARTYDPLVALETGVFNPRAVESFSVQRANP